MRWFVENSSPSIRSDRSWRRLVRAGKWIHEFLTVGQPITDELATKALIAYLRNLSNANGWALLDYPDTYEQMALLESSLLNWRDPLETVGSEPADREDIGTEEVDPASPRIEFRAGKEDAFSFNLNRQAVPHLRFAVTRP